MGIQTRMRENRGEQNAAQQISQILAQWKEAMETKNAARAVAFYADDAAMFTLAPPLGTKGMQQQALQAWFDTWKGGLEYEMRDAELVAGDDIAYCHSYTRMVGTKTSGEQNDVWFRATATLRKIDGQWKITHEHTSVPFHMDGSLKAALELQPPAGAQ